MSHVPLLLRKQLSAVPKFAKVMEVAKDIGQKPEFVPSLLFSETSEDRAGRANSPPPLPFKAA